MKKITLVTLILLSAVVPTNAQKNNGLISENKAGIAGAAGTNTEFKKSISLFTKDELLQFKSSNFNDNKTDLLTKSKNQKTAAWVLLGGGVVLIGTGLLIGDRAESSFDDAATGAVIAGIGVISAACSIPLFIASSRNKRKAASISFKNEQAPYLQNNMMAYKPVPSLTFKIKL